MFTDTEDNSSSRLRLHYKKNALHPRNSYRHICTTYYLLHAEV